MPSATSCMVKLQLLRESEPQPPTIREAAVRNSAASRKTASSGFVRSSGTFPVPSRTPQTTSIITPQASEKIEAAFLISSSSVARSSLSVGGAIVFLDRYQRQVEVPDLV